MGSHLRVNLLGMLDGWHATGMFLGACAGRALFSVTTLAGGDVG